MRLPTWFKGAGKSQEEQDQAKLVPKILSKTEPVEESAPVQAAQPETSQASSQKATQAERSRDRSLYKAILSSLYDAVIIVDQKGHIIASNERAEKFFGYAPEDFWDLPCKELIAGFSTLVLAKIRGHVSDGRFTVINANCLRKDASSFPAEIAISNIFYLGEDDLLFTIRSLERRKKAEERREVELDASRYTCIGLMVCNRDGLIEYANSACAQLLQHESEHKITQRFLGDFCESLQTTEQILRTPSQAFSWMGIAGFHTGKNKTVEFTVTSAMCPPRKDVPDRVVVSLVPSVKVL